MPFPDGQQRWLPIFQFPIPPQLWEGQQINRWKAVDTILRPAVEGGKYIVLICYYRESARTLCLCARASGVYGFNLTAGISTEYTLGPHSTSGHISTENAAKSHCHKKKLSFTLSLRILHFNDTEQFNILMGFIFIYKLTIYFTVLLETDCSMWKYTCSFCAFSSINSEPVLHEQHNTPPWWPKGTLHLWRGRLKLSTFLISKPRATQAIISL